MARNLINKYIWIIDTIQRHGRITRDELNRLWVKSSLSDGEPLARRTFYNYRQGILDTFNVAVECDQGTFEYYIDTSGSEQDGRLRNWLLDAASMSGMLSPELKQQIIGLAEVRDVFKSPKFGAIAGCMVTEGVVKRHNPIRVLRDNVVIYEGELESLRRFKDDVKSVKQGYECGIGLENWP